jgi:hypothetical protein
MDLLLGEDPTLSCGFRAIVNARIGHRERQDRRIVNAGIGMVNARIGIVNTVLAVAVF